MRNELFVRHTSRRNDGIKQLFGTKSDEFYIIYTALDNVMSKYQPFSGYNNGIYDFLRVYADSGTQQVS